MYEIEKMIAHANIPIIITNIGDNRFDKISMNVDYGIQKNVLLFLPVIKLPKVCEIFSFPLNVIFFKKFVEELLLVSKKKENNKITKTALSLPNI